MRYLPLLTLLILPACEPGAFDDWLLPVTAPVAAPVAPPTLDPTPPPPPPPTARTVEQFDTTSVEDRAAAVAAPSATVGTALGTTIATLGPPAAPGIWLKTPLVAELTMGRVDYPEKGTSVSLELRPSGGAAGAGSQISLAAMRLLDIPLTALAEVSVFAN